MIDSLLVAALILGCGDTPMETQLPVSRSRQYARAVDTLGVETTVNAPAARVWAVLPAVYASLGLPVNFRQPVERRVGTCYQPVRRLGTDPLSKFLECGETRAVPNADRYEVMLTVLSTVEEKGNEWTAIHTYVLGVARDPSTSTNRIWCQTRGSLEERIRDEVASRAAS